MKITIAMLRSIGVTDAQLAKLAELVDKNDQEIAAATRENERIRKRNYRAEQKLKAEQLQQSRPESPRDASDALGQVGTSERSLSSKKVTNLESKKERALTNSRGTFCPTDFTPSDSHYSLGSQLGLSRQQVEDQARQMAEWSGANRNRPVARKADWSLTFTGWLRRNFKPPQTADPELLPGKTPYERAAEYHRRFTGTTIKEHKPNGKDHGVSSPNRRGDQSAGDESELFSEGDVFHPDEHPKR